jgi:hypothetical protein
MAGPLRQVGSAAVSLQNVVRAGIELVPHAAIPMSRD